MKADSVVTVDLLSLMIRRMGGDTLNRLISLT